MKTIFKALALASLSVTALSMTAVPAAAQIGGIATANTIVAIAKAKALIPAYKQIDDSYKSYYDQLQTKGRERNELLAKLDKNGDKNFDQSEMDAAEAAKDPNLALIAGKEKEMEALQEPIVKAKMYVLSQIAGKYSAAQQTVVTTKKITMLLAPDAFIWAQPTVDVTTAITAEIDKLLPVAAATPPASWNPNQQIYEVYQQVQQLIAASIQAQAARTQTPAAPAGAQPVGR